MNEQLRSRVCRERPPAGWIGYARALWNLALDAGMTLRESDEFTGSPFGQAITRAMARVARDWQPIATAPQDGRVVLLYGVEHRRRVWARGHYFKGVPGDGEGWVASIIYTEPEDDTRGSFMNPTHWMPLPEPPE